MKIVYRKSFYLKFLLVALGLIISAATIFYTNSLVEKIQQREKNLAEMYAGTWRYMLNSTSEINDFSFVIENIINKIEFPIIYTEVVNGKDNFNIHSLKLNSKNISLPQNLSESEQKQYIDNLIKELDQIRPPIQIEYYGQTIGKIHYGDSDLVKQLKIYPYFQILFAIFFVIIAYISFSHIKRNEQSNLWVGLSKETAHQLGTPISSLLGWNEYLKLNYNTPEKVVDISEEIENDLERLKKISQRFSKIGSNPDFKMTNVYEIVEKVTQYFNRRLPQTGKTINLEISGNQFVQANICSELFEWVIENLTKNALDAIESKDGKISYSILEIKNKIIIEIADTGKGISKKNKKLIFRPGFSTKKRGWGLGLSLAKRIVEDYHRGKLLLKSSEINAGTTFQIIINTIPK